MGKKIRVDVSCTMDIEVSSSPEQMEEDIQDAIKWAIQRVQVGYDERVSWSDESTGSDEDDKELWKTFNLGMDTFKEYYFCLWD